MLRNARKKNMSSFLLVLVRGCEGHTMVGPCIGWAIELIAHFSGAISFSVAAGEEVVQPADKAKEPDDAAKGVAELCELVDDASEVDSSSCEAYEGLHN